LFFVVGVGCWLDLTEAFTLDGLLFAVFEADGFSDLGVGFLTPLFSFLIPLPQSGPLQPMATFGGGDE